MRTDAVSACSSKGRLKARNQWFHPGNTFFGNFRDFGKWKLEKKLRVCRRKVFLNEENRSEANRTGGDCAIPDSHAKSSDEPDWFPSLSHFRPCVFWTVGTPGGHRSSRNDGPLVQKDSRAPGNASRDTFGICIKPETATSIRNRISI